MPHRIVNYQSPWNNERVELYYRGMGLGRDIRKLDAVETGARRGQFSAATKNFPEILQPVCGTNERAFRPTRFEKFTLGRAIFGRLSLLVKTLWRTSTTYFRNGKQKERKGKKYMNRNNFILGAANSVGGGFFGDFEIFRAPRNLVSLVQHSQTQKKGYCQKLRKQQLPLNKYVPTFT